MPSPALAYTHHESVDWSAPINPDWFGNDRLAFWYMACPHVMGGLTWKDLVPGGVEGTISNVTASAAWHPETDCPGHWGHLALDTASDEINLGAPATADMGTSDFTLSWWGMPFDASAALQGLFARNVPGAANFLWCDYRNQKLLMFMNNGGTDGFSATSGSYGTSAGGGLGSPGGGRPFWFNFRYMRDNAASQLRLFVNGKEDTVINSALTPAYSITNATMYHGSTSGGGSQFSNYSCQLKLNMRAYTPAEILALFEDEYDFNRCALRRIEDAATAVGNPWHHYAQQRRQACA